MVSNASITMVPIAKLLQVLNICISIDKTNYKEGNFFYGKLFKGIIRDLRYYVFLAKIPIIETRMPNFTSSKSY